MSDRHVRILAMVARASQRRLDDDDAAGATDAVSRERRGRLRLRAAETRARLAAARVRKRPGSDGEDAVS